MGLGGISIWQLLIVLLIVVMLFGTKKLKGLGGDLGGAVKGFKDALNNESADKTAEAEPLQDKSINHEKV
ncbi:MAG: Sec-independent protein translocase subunit TatA [Endozoicomonas sp.]